MRWLSVLVVFLIGCTAPMSPEEGLGGPGDDAGVAGATDGGVPPSENSTADEDAASASDVTSGENATADLHLDVKVWRCDDRWCLNATATNVGETTYHYSAICAPAFYERMYDPHGPVTPREPWGYCAAWMTQPLPPGEKAYAGLVWDERVYDHDQDQMVDAPPGHYEWGTLFVAYQDEDGRGAVKLQATATVHLE